MAWKLYSCRIVIAMSALLLIASPCDVNQLFHNALSITVEVTRHSANVSLTGLVSCEGIQANLSVDLGSTVRVCQRTHILHNWLNYTCPHLELNRALNLTYTIRTGDQTFKERLPFYTTDIQNITASPGSHDASITCHFAPGASCDGCVVHWRDTSTPEGVNFEGEVEVHRAMLHSRNATGTVKHLNPGHTYRVVAYDLESNGERSGVGVPLEDGLTTEPDAGGQDGNTLTLVFVTVIAGFAVVVVAVAVIVVWRMKGQVTVRGIIEQRKREKRNKRQKKKKKEKEDDDFDFGDPPPVPPYTAEMFIPVTSSSTSTDSTESTTVDDNTNGDSVFEDELRGTHVQNSVTNTNHHTFMVAATLETISYDGDAPPVPPRTEEMLLLTGESELVLDAVSATESAEERHGNAIANASPTAAANVDDNDSDFEYPETMWSARPATVRDLYSAALATSPGCPTISLVVSRPEPMGGAEKLHTGSVNSSPRPASHQYENEGLLRKTAAITSAEAATADGHTTGQSMNRCKSEPIRHQYENEIWCPPLHPSPPPLPSSSTQEGIPSTVGLQASTGTLTNPNPLRQNFQSNHLMIPPQIPGNLYASSPNAFHYDCPRPLSSSAGRTGNTETLTTEHIAADDPNSRWIALKSNPAYRTFTKKTLVKNFY